MITYTLPCIFAALFYFSSISLRRDLDEMRSELNKMYADNREVIKTLQEENEKLKKKIKKLEEHIERQKKLIHADEDEYRKIMSEDLEPSNEPTSEAEKVAFEILKDRLEYITK